MSQERLQVREAVRGFILSEFLPNEDPSHFTDSTALISGGILDSISTIRMVTFLEDRFEITLEQKDVTVEGLDSIDRITDTVNKKMATPPRQR